MRLAALILGIVLTLWAVVGFTRSMLVASHSMSAVDKAANAVFSAVGYRVLRFIPSYKAQDHWLSFLAPIVLLLRLMIYVIILIFTVGLIVYGCSDDTMLGSFYQSGSTLTTLGVIGNLTVASAIAIFFGAFLGLVIVAVFIGYLMSLYADIKARESEMVQLTPLAGEPAWGPQILARAHILRLPAQEAPMIMDWVKWIGDLRMNQRANPLESEFRSSSATRHWVVTMLTVLDAVALRIALTGKDLPHDIQLLTEGSVTLALFDNNKSTLRSWDIEVMIHREMSLDTNMPVDAATAEAAQLSDKDWEAGIEALKVAEYPLPDDLEAAKHRFLNIRAVYATQAYNLAYRFHAVRAPWSGTRRTNIEVLWPELASTRTGKASA